LEAIFNAWLNIRTRNWQTDTMISLLRKLISVQTNRFREFKNVKYYEYQLFANSFKIQRHGLLIFSNILKWCFIKKNFFGFIVFLALRLTGNNVNQDFWLEPILGISMDDHLSLINQLFKHFDYTPTIISH